MVVFGNQGYCQCIFYIWYIKILEIKANKKAEITYKTERHKEP